METISRRQFVAGSALTAAAVACCGLTAPSIAHADDTIELTYWYCWTDQIKENNEERVAEFNETIGKEKGIHVTAEYQGSYDDLNTKLKSAFVANEEPDVCVMVINGTSAFADGGMIQPLTELVTEDDVNDFWPGLMENCYVDGTLYGVPYLRSTPVLYYNKTLFEAAGLDPEKGPETWDDVVSFSDALAASGVGGYGFYSYIWALTAFTYCNGGAMFGDELSAQQATFNQPEGVETVEWFRDGVQNHNFQFYAGAAGTDTLDTNATNQQIGMWVNSTANLTQYKNLAEQNGFEVSCCFIPKHVQNKVPTGGCNLVMTSRLADERRSAAADFINFMTNKDSAIKNHLKTGYLLTRQSCADDDRIKEAYATTPEYQVAFDQLEYAVGDYMNAGYAEAAKVYTDAVEQLVSGSDDVQQVLDNAAQQCNSILSE